MTLKSFHSYPKIKNTPIFEGVRLYEGDLVDIRYFFRQFLMSQKAAMKRIVHFQLFTCG